jgi:hypothetical protein
LFISHRTSQVRPFYFHHSLETSRKPKISAYNVNILDACLTNSIEFFAFSFSKR